MIFVEADLGTIFDPFWIPKSLQNRPQLKTHARFGTPSRTSKNQFFDQLDPNLAPKWVPKNYFFACFWEPKRDLEHPKAPTTASFQFWTDFGTILDRFGGRFWMAFGYIFECFFKYLLFVICPLLFVVCCLLLEVCCLLSVLCYLLCVSFLLFLVCRVLFEVVRLFLILFAGCLLLAACATFTELSPTRPARRNARSA